MSKENLFESSAQPCVLLFGFESQLKKRICDFLLTVGCTCNEAATKHEIQGASFDALLLDLTNANSRAGEIISAIKQVRPDVSKRILLVIDAGQTKKFLHEPLPKVSRETPLPQLWTKLQEILAAQTARNPVPRGMTVAHLVFDSFQSPPPLGLRGGMQRGSRQLAYQHSSTRINLLIQGNSEQVSLVGQVLDVSLRDVNARPVLLRGPEGELKCTSTSQYGEFGFEFEFVSDGSLGIHLSDGTWLYLPLKDLGWLKKIDSL